MPAPAYLLASLLFVPPTPPAGGVPGADGDLRFTTEEFVAAKERWLGWRGAGTILRVEGRVWSKVRNTLRLQNLPLTVRPATGTTLDRVTDRVRRVEVTGRLRRGPTGSDFEATAVRLLPDDLETFRERRAALDRADPAAWDALAEWAERRATFYDDKPLADRAAEARAAAFALRWDAAGGVTTRPEDAPAGTPPAVFARLTLLDGPAAAGLAEDEKRARRHAVLRDWWRATRDDRDVLLSPLAARLAKLPGADRPAADSPRLAELRTAYEKAPERTYEAADPETRRVLHRLFYAAVERERIERSAAPDGRDGYAVADRLAAAVPEFPALADRYRDRELTWREGRVDRATRGELTELLARLEARGESRRAAEARAGWLAARESQLRGDGVGGLVRAAEAYRAVAGDDAAAVRLLKEAFALAPAGSDAESAVADKLEGLGLRRVGERWLDGADAAALPADPVAEAVRAGRVVAGMTAAQVRKALGEPPARTRAASVAAVTEVWVYAAPRDAFGPAAGGLAVHLTRPRGTAPADATVVAVTRL